jgi:hypothetical protein
VREEAESGFRAQIRRIAEGSVAGRQVVRGFLGSLSSPAVGHRLMGKAEIVREREGMFWAREIAWPVVRPFGAGFWSCGSLGGRKRGLSESQVVSAAS